MLEGDLTYAMLIKMYTNQCFSKYPHFQLADLNEGRKFSNNAQKFRSSFGKGKQGKGKGKGREANTYREWRNDKGKRGNPETKGPDPTMMDKPTPKIRPKQKGKEMQKNT